MTDTNTAKFTLQLTIPAVAGAPRVPLQLEESEVSTLTPTQLRLRVSEVTTIPLAQLKLIFRGRLIADNDNLKVLTEFRLEDGSVLHCMGKPTSNTTATASPVVTTQQAGPTVSVASTPTPVQQQSLAAAAAAPSVTGIADPLAAALLTLRTQNSSDHYVTAITTLDKILSNILQNPLEEKYRRVKKQNAAFQKRLGGISGGHAALTACGFTSTVHEGDEVYLLQASAEAWNKLQVCKHAVETALTDAKRQQQPAAAAASVPNLIPPQFMNQAGFMGAGAGMPMGGAGMPPGMDAAMASILSDPTALQNMLQNPMLQQMIRNDPRFANNPMLQASMEQLASNPAMVQQVAAMMRDPNMQRQMQQAMGAAGGGGPFGGIPGVGIGAGLGAGGMPANRAANAGQQQQQPPSGASDEEMTEEEMIAEAIRRSLQEG